MLAKPEDVTIENMKLAYILGWCTELQQTSLLIFDDILDNSSMRRGQICWHKLPHVGKIAINDAFLIEKSIYALLRKYFKESNFYMELMQLFHDTLLISSCGERVELMTAKNSVLSFNMETYNGIITNKTAYTSFYLSFMLAMYLSEYV